LSRFTGTGAPESYDGQELIQAWCALHLQNIGEAANSLPREVCAMAPDLPWRKIIDMRNILVHHYFQIGEQLVWDAVESELPRLKRRVEEILAKLDRK
jgi:uncharacterized protein with HEPN domain